MNTVRYKKKRSNIKYRADTPESGWHETRTLPWGKRSSAEVHSTEKQRTEQKPPQDGKEKWRNRHGNTHHPIRTRHFRFGHRRLSTLPPAWQSWRVLLPVLLSERSEYRYLRRMQYLWRDWRAMCWVPIRVIRRHPPYGSDCGGGGIQYERCLMWNKNESSYKSIVINVKNYKF